MVLVPLSAVLAGPDGAAAQVVRDGGVVETRRVRLGLQDATRVEVAEGLAEGERVVTSAEAGAFPAGLPVGTVRYGAGGGAEVAPAARLDRLEVVRIFDYGLRGVRPPESPARPADSRPAPRR